MPKIFSDPYSTAFVEARLTFYSRPIGDEFYNSGFSSYDIRKEMKGRAVPIVFHLERLQSFVCWVK